MDKSIKFFILLVLAVLYSEISIAGTCQVDDAEVVEVFQYDDGSIFIKLDKSDSSCICTKKNRFKFHKDDNEIFFSSAALAALAGKLKVKARGSDTECGATAKLTAFYIYAN